MTGTLWQYALIAAGSAIGGVGRYWLGGLVAQRVGETFPWGTLAVNVSGSFAIGMFATLTGTEGRFLVSPAMRQFFMLGLCGGYTTFSSFSLQTLNLAREGEFLRAGLNILAAVALALLAVWCGHAAAAALNGMKGS